MNREEKYSLVLLAGGKSSRMGKDKAKLIYKGRTFTEVLVSKARDLGIKDIYVSGFDEEDVQVVWDVYPERGPLGGIHACMKQVKTPFCLVVPVDVPQIPKEVLEMLLEHHEKFGCQKEEKKLPLLIKHGDRRENLIGIYPVQMVRYIEELIKDHPASVHGILERWGHECLCVNVSQWQVENINTQENYKELLSMSLGEN